MMAVQYHIARFTLNLNDKRRNELNQIISNNATYTEDDTSPSLLSTAVAFWKAMSAVICSAGISLHCGGGHVTSGGVESTNQKATLEQNCIS